MKRASLLTLFLLIITVSFCFFSLEIESLSFEEEENPVQTYAILFDQFATEINGTTVCSAVELKETLLNLGWLDENITLFLGEENITKTIILEQLNYLEQVVDDNDLVFVYIMAHGHTYCRDVLNFNSWFQTEFFQIDTKNKVYLMDSCYAGEFVRNFFGDCFAMGSVGEYEVAIAYLPEENGTWELTEPPFAGGISSHFWAKSLINMEADTSLDGVISLNEMYIHSLPKIRECYNETFELYPDMVDYVENLAGYTENYPYPKVMNNLPYEITLNATDFALNNDNYLWEDDIEAPEILSQDIIYFSDESEIDITFQIRDRSAFDIYCYVNDQLDIFASTSQAATGSEFWNYTYELEVEPNHNYNVSLAALDEWSNRNENFTLVIFNGNTNTADYEITILVLCILPIMVLSLKARKRKG
jgi:hypothetical protein